MDVRHERRIGGLTPKAQLQPKEVEHAKRAHNRSAVNCNLLLAFALDLLAAGRRRARAANLSLDYGSPRVRTTHELVTKLEERWS